jgi:AcrR family transcriptional regulator
MSQPVSKLKAQKKPAPKPRATYRHGDLWQALLEAGLEQARAGGPEAVVLREATRRVGVVPTAAYRHFASREAWLLAVRSGALAALADAIAARLSSISARLKPAARARAGLRAVGAAYLDFAQDEPGLFRTAFAACDDNLSAADLAHSTIGRGNPFHLLGQTLDQMVTAGVLAAARRPGAEFLVWSALHGLAMLLVDGPLRGLPRQQGDAITDNLLDMIEKGL